MNKLSNIKRLSILCMIAFSLVLTFGCSKKDEGAKGVTRKRTDDSPVVARVGGGSVTVSDLKSYLSDRSISHRYRVSKEDLTKRLDELVLEEVLYQEALRVNLDQDPEVRRNIRQMLTSRLMDDYMNREVWSKEIDETELQEYYDEHWNEFNRPEQVRIADIFIAVPADASAEQRAELKKRAQTVLDKALEARATRSGFSMLIREYSDTSGKYRKGDTGFFDERGDPVGIDKVLVEAAFALERVGAMAEYVIETTDGHHVIMLTGKRSGVNIPLENVRNKLEQRIRREAAAKARKAYIEGLKESAVIEVDRKVLSNLLEEIKNKAPARRPSLGKGRTPSSQGSLSPPALPGR